MHTCEPLKRYLRCTKIGNPVTIKLAQRELLLYIQKMNPLDLVNTVKHFPKNEVGSAVVGEILKRNFSKFNSKDIAVLVPSIRLLGDAQRKEEILGAVFPVILPLITSMRTTDMCMTLWGLTKLNIPPTDMQPILDAVLSLLAKDNCRRMQIMNHINISQLLLTFSKYAQNTKNGEFIVFEELLKFLTAENFASKIQDDAMAFHIYSVANISQTIRFPVDHPVKIQFFEKMKNEVKTRRNLSPIQLVDCIRGLGRAGICDKEIVDFLLLPALESNDLKLKPEQKESIDLIIKQFST